MKTAFVFDLDGTINHAEAVPDGLVIRGQTRHSFMSRRALELLLELAEITDLYVATGRSLASVADFRKHFARAGLRISGWILEHGAIVAQHPAWQERILAGIDRAALCAQLDELRHKNGWAIDGETQGSHQIVLRYTVREPEYIPSILAQLPNLLGNQWRMLVEARKIIFIPQEAAKYPAFQAVFGKTQYMQCAAGDTIDDLTLLENATFPLTLNSAAPLVQESVRQQGGFVAAHGGHQGTVAMLEAAVTHLNSYNKQEAESC